MGRKQKGRIAVSADAEKLLRHIVAGCLKAKGLPCGPAAVSGAIELIEAGFAVVRSDGVSHWLEAVDG